MADPKPPRSIAGTPDTLTPKFMTAVITAVIVSAMVDADPGAWRDIVMMIEDTGADGIEGAEIVGSQVVATEAGIASVLVRVNGPRAGVAATAQAGALRGALAGAPASTTTSPSPTGWPRSWPGSTRGQAGVGQMPLRNNCDTRQASMPGMCL